MPSGGGIDMTSVHCILLLRLLSEEGDTIIAYEWTMPRKEYRSTIRVLSARAIVSSSLF
jgi:hypothetical protein